MADSGPLQKKKRRRQAAVGERDEQDAPRRLFREAPGRGPTADAKVRWEVVAMDIAAVVELSGGGGRLEALRVVTARGNKSAGRIHPPSAQRRGVIR